FDIVRRAFIAAIKRQGQDLRAGVTDGQERAVLTDAIVHPQAATTRPAALTTLFRVDFHAVDDKPVAWLRDFGGAVVCLAMEAREDARVAISAVVCAPATDLRLDNGVVTSRIGMASTNEG